MRIPEWVIGLIFLVIIAMISIGVMEYNWIDPSKIGKIHFLILAFIVAFALLLLLVSRFSVSFPLAPIFFAILTLILLLGIGKYGLKPILQTSKAQPQLAEITLPILAVISAITLLVILSFLSSAFAAMGLSDKSRALGLPEGSVRALIALILLTIFVIMAIFLYRQTRFPLSGAVEASYTGISAEQLVRIPQEQLIKVEPSKVVKAAGANEILYDVVRRIPPIWASEASEKFAQQILTAVITLVASIAAFYFGAKSVAAARGIAAPLKPDIRKFDPPEGHPGDVDLEAEILGKNFSLPNTVKLVLESDETVEITLVEIMSSATKVEGKFNIAQEQTKGTYTLIVVNADGGEGRLVNAFKVKEKE